MTHLTHADWKPMSATNATKDSLLVAEDVWRSFGAAPALQGVGFTATAGEVTGLVGPNGSGQDDPVVDSCDSSRSRSGTGSHRWPRSDEGSTPSQKILGWVPDTFGFYENLTAHEYLGFAGAARRLSAPSAQARATELLEVVHLGAYSAQPVHVLSRGTKATPCLRERSRSPPERPTPRRTCRGIGSGESRRPFELGASFGQ